ncbi:ATP-binding cassette domain-containing protein [Sphaerisporangium sp. TRM90804]|uniref:ABC transporter ATP-binding protein n=1 Tax=Sphaerisporangium sp. TRM90804 TaxID=3031113 RepID=UPI002448694E|nr:ATP-binding cassette domain-containing protein [Sphaerisporangium sp. TRM90804]MDH2430120.1 ATP-binding cassette domain-containing protein [Sphaerisporangium sp. TRM90804]
MRLANLSFRYARKAPWVLHEVGLELPSGTIAEVKGRNGAGKSTLLRLLAGTARPTRGSISGRPPVVGFAPEIFPAQQPFTVSAYLAHVTAVRGLPSSVIGTWAERLGMENLLGTPLADLSKGSAHKVGLAQALLASPGLLVLDEPFSGLDERTRAELPLAMAELAGAGGIVVLSDHQNGLAGHPGVTHLTVEDAAVHHPASGTTGHGTTAKAVIEVTVDAGEAEAVTRKLRADGYAARIRPGTAPADPGPTPTGPAADEHHAEGPR